MIVDPRGLSVSDWCDSMALVLQALANPIILLNPLNWQEWALSVIQAPAIAAVTPPDPRFFADWQEWAIRFNQAIEPLV